MENRIDYSHLSERTRRLLGLEAEEDEVTEAQTRAAAAAHPAMAQAVIALKAANKRKDDALLPPSV